MFIRKLIYRTENILKELFQYKCISFCYYSLSHAIRNYKVHRQSILSSTFLKASYDVPLSVLLFGCAWLVFFPYHCGSPHTIWLVAKLSLSINSHFLTAYEAIRHLGTLTELLFYPICYPLIQNRNNLTLEIIFSWIKAFKFRPSFNK